MGDGKHQEISKFFFSLHPCVCACEHAGSRNTSRLSEPHGTAFNVRRPPNPRLTLTRCRRVCSRLTWQAPSLCVASGLLKAQWKVALKWKWEA